MKTKTANVALVTGASSGIGARIAERLLGAGYTVYAAARRGARLVGLVEAGAKPLVFDVTDDAAMTAAVETIVKNGGRLDVLVNNAGYGALGALEDVPPGQARRQFDVNLFAPARLIQLVLPLMRAQRAGKIVNISSIGGKIGEPFGAWYHASKYALEGLSDCLRQELHPFGIDVILIEPGLIDTEWPKIAADGLTAAAIGGAYENAALATANYLRSDQGFAAMASKPDVIARTVMKAVAAKCPKARYAAGGGAGPILALNWLLPDGAKDALARMMFAGQIKKGNR